MEKLQKKKKNKHGNAQVIEAAMAMIMWSMLFQLELRHRSIFGRNDTVTRKKQNRSISYIHTYMQKFDYIVINYIKNKF